MRTDPGVFLLITDLEGKVVMPTADQKAVRNPDDITVEEFEKEVFDFEPLDPAKFVVAGVLLLHVDD